MNRLLTGWLLIATCEIVLSRGLRAPPGAGGAVELAGLALIGWIHSRLGRRVLASWWSPGVLFSAAWLAAWLSSPRGYASEGGAPLHGGALAAGIAVAVATALALVGRRYSSPEKWWDPLLAGLFAAPVAALGLVASAAHDPTLSPRELHLDALLGAALIAAAVGGALGGLAIRRPRASGLAAVGIGLLFCLHRPPPPPRGGQDVILISVDTLRADAAMGMQSYQRLAAMGEQFTDAYSTSCWTVPAMASVLTGLWAEHHQAGRNSDRWLEVDGVGSETQTLPEWLGQAGFRTGAVTTNAFLSSKSGFSRGFESWDPARSVPDAALLLPWLAGLQADLHRARRNREDAVDRVDAALAWLDDGDDRRNFLWLHLVDPHLPYFHVEFAEDDPLRSALGERPGDDLDMQLVRTGRLRTPPQVRAALHEAYLRQVEWVDVQLARLLDGLDARGRLAGAVVLFTADHGEEFWDHGGFEHGHAMWPEITRVPLVLVRPDGPRGAVRSDPASLVDVAPTLLAASGVAVQQPLDGIDLALDVPADRRRQLFGTLYGPDLRAVLVPDWVVVASDGAPARLYDLHDDPEWRIDIAAERPEVVTALTPWLPAPVVRDGQEAPLDLQGLRALGYIE